MIRQKGDEPCLFLIILRRVRQEKFTGNDSSIIIITSNDFPEKYSEPIRCETIYVKKILIILV